MRLRVRTYLIIALMFASGLPLAVFWVWPHARIVETETEKVSDRYLLLAQNLSTVLELYHRDVVTTLGAFADAIADGGGAEAAVLFQDLNFREICVVDAVSGDVRTSYFPETYPCPDQMPPEKMALFQQLVSTQEVGMSRVLRPSGAAPRIYLATKSGTDLVVGAINTDFFQQTFEQVKFGRQGHALVVDHTGQVLAHPKPDWAARAVSLADLAPVVGVLNGEDGVAQFFSPALQQEMLSGFATVPGPGWGVIVPQPVSELEEVAAQFNRDSLVVLSVGLGFSLLLALVVSVQFSRRLGNIATAVRRLTQEQDGVRVRTSRDLIGVRELLALETGVNKLAADSETARSSQLAHNSNLEAANEKLRQEMTERRNAVAGQRHSEIRFRSLFESAPIPIREEDLSGMKRLIDELCLPGRAEFGRYLDEHPEFLEACGRSIRVVDANEASLALHGYTDKDQMLARVVRSLSPAAMKIVRMTVETIHEGQHGRSYETRITRTDGQVRTVQATWSVIPGHEDTYSRILLSSVDLTDRLQSEEALRQAQKMEAVGQLTGGVAHDFNNLLTVIGGNLELLDASHALDPDLAAPIHKAVRRGAELTQRLLAFSRKQPLVPQAIDLDELVAGMTNLLQRSLGEEVSVLLQTSDDRRVALADAGQVEAALLNLALNSRDAMPNGGTLTIARRSHHVDEDSKIDAPPGDYVAIHVSDTGDGMTPETLARAVEPFYTTKEVGKGSGLGLSMVYGFAKQSGGDLQIESTLGHGTTVSLYLPTADVARDCPVQHEVTETAVVGKGRKVLILEDDAGVRDYLVRLLSSSGFDGLPADGIDAAASILDESEQIDVLLSDVMLPGGTLGTEFAVDVVRRHPRIGVVFISGRPSEARLHHSPDLNGAPLLTKPFDRHELISSVLSVIRSG